VYVMPELEPVDCVGACGAFVAERHMQCHSWWHLAYASLAWL
jgi:hypothetical protein